MKIGGGVGRIWWLDKAETFNGGEDYEYSLATPSLGLHCFSPFA